MCHSRGRESPPLCDPQQEGVRVSGLVQTMMTKKCEDVILFVTIKNLQISSHSLYLHKIELFFHHRKCSQQFFHEKKRLPAFTFAVNSAFMPYRPGKASPPITQLPDGIVVPSIGVRFCNRSEMTAPFEILCVFRGTLLSGKFMVSTKFFPRAILGNCSRPISVFPILSLCTSHKTGLFVPQGSHVQMDCTNPS